MADLTCLNIHPVSEMMHFIKVVVSNFYWTLIININNSTMYWTAVLD